jgi:SAM-dependent methyltransferase
MLNPKQRLRIETRHRDSIQRHGYRVGALFWSSTEIQHIRFEVLSQIMDGYTDDSRQNKQPYSVLDVGCGFGDLKHYLSEKGEQTVYHGIDVSPDMVRSAGFQSPGIHIETGDIFDLDPPRNSYDFVLLSGALNEVVDDKPAQEGDYARAVIQKMYHAADKAVAFNLLDARHEWTANRPDLQSFMPDQIIEFCQSFAREVRLVDGYLENDFTVYLFKSESVTSMRIKGSKMLV